MKFFIEKKYAIGAAVAAVTLVFVAFLIGKKCGRTDKDGQANADPAAIAMLTDSLPVSEPPLATIPVTQPVIIANYFKYMDDLVQQYDSLVPYSLSEYLIVRANPWLIDTLENTDYYRQIEKGNFVFDQTKMTVLHPGDTLYLPGEKTASVLLAKMEQTYLDINIPAFQLRIIEGDSVLHTFPVRVGKNQKKFLAMAGNVVDLRTQTGTGEIVRVNRYPVFYDPVTGDEFKLTKRDDHQTTLMPQIPWLEPALEGRRIGQLIHPTTNPKSLGKPASNGCIGTREADAWRIYYAAPVGTKVVVRYDLMEITAQGDTLRWNDVYQYGLRGKKGKTYASVLFPMPSAQNACWCYP